MAAKTQPTSRTARFMRPWLANNPAVNSSDLPGSTKPSGTPDSTKMMTTTPRVPTVAMRWWASTRGDGISCEVAEDRSRLRRFDAETPRYRHFLVARDILAATPLVPRRSAVKSQAVLNGNSAGPRPSKQRSPHETARDCRQEEARGGNRR